MRILMVASEAVPFAKTGGLADVAGALPKALARLGHEVEVVMPRYRGITAGERVGRITVTLGTQPLDAGVFAVSADGVRTVFIDHPGYFDRDGIYGTQGQDFADNPERFAFLAHAALRWAALTGARYDVIHCHDWQSGLVPVILSMASQPAPALARVPVVFTIHNLAYQGVFEGAWLPRLGLGNSLMRVDGMEYWGRISFLKAGIVFSRMVTTVSPRRSTGSASTASCANAPGSWWASSTASTTTSGIRRPMRTCRSPTTWIASKARRPPSGGCSRCSGFQ
jgi:starch synthase